MRELIYTHECYKWDNRKDPETRTFLYTAVMWKEEGNYYYVELPVRMRKEDINLDAIAVPEQPVDLKTLRAPWRASDGLVEVDASIMEKEDIYIKSISIQSYPGAELRGERVIGEAKILEKIKALGGHPNLCEYLGCVRDQDGYITGLAYKKCEMTLENFMSVPDSDIDFSKRIRIWNDILAGVSFLHDNGFIHNRLTPTNIMLDKSGRAVITNFLGCKEAGVNTGYTWGAPSDWSRDYDANAPETDSIFAHDEYCLDLLHNLLFSECPKVDAGFEHSLFDWSAHVCGWYNP